MKNLEKRIFRLAEIVEIISVSKATIYRWIAQGSFPKPIKLGGPRSRSVGWKSTDIDEWIKDRVQA